MNDTTAEPPDDATPTAWRERATGLARNKWAVALLIGFAVILAALFGWRAAQIGSTAAFDDRQAISETIKVEQQQINDTVTGTGDAREYARYAGDYAVAAALEAEARADAAAGDSQAAAQAREEAKNLRRGATQRAADAGVFGPFSISDDLRTPSATPRPFSIETRQKAIEAEEATALDSPGKLNPGRWAAEAEAIRHRVNGLVVWSFFCLVAVLLFTIAHTWSDRFAVFYGAAVIGVVVLILAAIGGFATDFFA